MEAESHKDISIDLEEIESATLTSDDLNKIGSFFVYDEKGLRLQMSELWSEFKTIFVFVRVRIFLVGIYKYFRILNFFLNL